MVYNLFNIDMSGNGNEAIERGFKHAYENGWFSRDASIRGGVSFIKKQYIDKGQATLYFQKYNVIKEDTLCSNQYMQNIEAAKSEGKIMYDDYKAANMIDSHFSFVIPLFENMPQNKAPSP